MCIVLWYVLHIVYCFHSMCIELHMVYIVCITVYIYVCVCVTHHGLYNIKQFAYMITLYAHYFNPGAIPV